MSDPRRGRVGCRFPVAALLAVILVAASASTLVVTVAAQDSTAEELACAGGDDGVVFRTDAGLEVVHEGRSLGSSPFVNETTLSFPNVTVAASDNASLQVASATDRRVCVTDVDPTEAPLVVAPTAGPTVVVADPLDSLTYGSVDYSPTKTGPDLAYSAPSAARIDVEGVPLEPGQTVEAVDAESRTVLDAGNVTDIRTLALQLPDGTRTVDLRLAPSGTPTPTPTPTETATVSAGGDSEGSAGGSSGGTETSVVNASGDSRSERSVGWTAELVDYEPSPQTQHVGGFLPLATLLWLLAIWLLWTRDGRETAWLALVLVVASVRATSDLLHVLIDGFVGGEASLVAINMVLELSIAVLFAQFAAVYADEQRLTAWRGKLGLAVVGILGTIGILTNPMHGLVFADAGVAGGPFTYVTTTARPGGWLLFAVEMVLLVAGGGLVIRSILGPSLRSVWRPVGVIGVGICLAVAIGLASMFDRGPVPGYDYSALGVNYFVLLTAVSLTTYGLQRLKSSGEQSVIANLGDPIVVLDDAWTVVEWNAAAGRLLPDLEVGRSFDAVVPEPLQRPSPGEATSTELSISVDEVATEATQSRVPDTDAGDAISEVDPDYEQADERASADVAMQSDPLDDALDDGAGGHDAGSLESGSASAGVTDRRREKHFIVRATAVMTETNARIGYAVQFADVTNLKRRTMDLEARNDQLDQFATAITQDLRTPLTDAGRATDQAVELLESAARPDGVDRSRFSACLRRTEEALDRMIAVIEDILDLARNADIETDPQPVAFERVVESAWESVERPGATLRVESGGEITADSEHLRSVLEHLVRNSVEHGGEEVTVTVGLDDTGFYVGDDGPGVSRDVRTDLFDPGVTTKDDGSGLGLAVAEKRASAHGWQISLDPTHDGARFVVTGCETAPHRDASRRGDE